jgi:hypothetical protein
VQELPSSDIELGLPSADEPALAEPAPTEESTPEKPPLVQLQTELDKPLYTGLVRVRVKLNPQWGYRIDDELKLVLPVEAQPQPEYLQWLLDNESTAGRVRRLIERNPEWGLLIDGDGHLRDF